MDHQHGPVHYVPASPGWWVIDENDPRKQAPVLAWRIEQLKGCPTYCPHVFPVTAGDIDEWDFVYQAPDGTFYCPHVSRRAGSLDDLTFGDQG